jgi:mRNA interferase RelE/StbE
LALEIKLTATARKYFESLDKSTKKRIQAKLNEIALAPSDPRCSKPLTNASKRTARVGDLRILFEVEGNFLFVANIGPRGQIYKRMRK